MTRWLWKERDVLSRAEIFRVLRNFALVPKEFARLKFGDRRRANFFFHPQTVASRHRAAVSALYRPRPIFHRWNLAPRRTWRAWKVKIASASHYCIVGVARHPVKVKQFAGPYIDARCHVPFFSLFPFLLSVFFCSPIRWFLPSLRRILVDTRVARGSPTLKLSTR